MFMKLNDIRFVELDIRFSGQFLAVLGTPS